MLHKEASLGHRHAFHNWEVADSAALTALTPTATDKGKIAWQLDTDDFYVLVDDTGPTWVNLVFTTGDSAVTSVNGASGTVVLDAGDISFTPAGRLSGTDVQAALTELEAESKQWFGVACSDETTALTVGTGKATLAIPIPFKILSVAASLTTAQASGSTFTVDINAAGASILSTKLTIDNTEKNSSTAATPAVISDDTLAAFDELSFDIDQVGDGTAKGLKVYIVGYPLP